MENAAQEDEMKEVMSKEAGKDTEIRSKSTCPQFNKSPRISRNVSIKFLV